MSSEYIAALEIRIIRLAKLLTDATTRLEDFIGADCECDNTHRQNNTVCALCEYRAEIALTRTNP